MKYKFLGTVLKAGCTPQPLSSLTDNRTCRERNPECEGECISYVTCSWCGKEKRTLSGLKDMKTGLTFELCEECKENIKDEIDYVR